MATNANANGIPFLKRTGIPPAIKNSMVVYYDIKKQGCTNENMKANPVLKDFSGNGNDGQCNNFAWNHESGIGDFVFKDFFISNKDNVNIKENIITITCNPDRYIGGIRLEYSQATRDIPSTKVRITGIKNTIYLNYAYRDSEGKEHILKITKDGNYNFPKSFNTIEGNGTANSLYLYNPNEIETVVTIEQLDYYKDAICTDGVDDYIARDLGIKVDNTTVVFDVDWSIDTKYCGIQLLGNLAIYNQDSSNYVFIKNRNIGTYYPKTIIAVSTDNKIYENNLNVITHNIEQEANFDTQALTLGGKSNNVYTKMYLRRIAVFNRVLTADEIKYVYEKIFGCKLKTMEERVEDSIILHYDVAKQGATNESMKTDPRLIDLSDHGYDAKLYNFAWTEDSGINTTTYPNALVFDGVDDYGVVKDIPILMPEVGFTVIAKRKILDTDKYCVAACSPGNALGFFLFEIGYIGSEEPAYPETYIYSFGHFNKTVLNENNDITYMTSKVYNGTSINIGTNNSIAPLHIGRRASTDSRILKGVIYSFMLFNRDLTTEEIEFVKQKYFSD